MTAPLKARLVDSVMQRVRDLRGDQTLDRTKCETALRNLGMKHGNAQRLMDETSDVQLSRVGEVARLLGVSAAALLSGDARATPVALAQPPATAPPTQPTQISLADALPVVLDALGSLTAGQWRMVRARLDDMPEHPEMRDDVASDVLPVLQAAATKHRRAG